MSVAVGVCVGTSVAVGVKVGTSVGVEVTVGVLVGSGVGVGCGAIRKADITRQIAVSNCSGSTFLVTFRSFLGRMPNACF